MKQAIAATLAVAAAIGGEARTTYKDLEARNYAYTYREWLAEHGKFHPGKEETFLRNLAKIREHNSNPAHTWKMGVNKFTAMEPKAFKKFASGYKAGKNVPGMMSARKPADLAGFKAVEDLPPSWDWRTHSPSVVTAVKDQGGCGGCWAFSATETLESFVALAGGSLMELSEQQILDCTPNPNQCGGTGGCNGATQELAFNYTHYGIDNMQPGLSLESQYPFQGYSQACQESKIKNVISVTGYVTLPFNNYSALMNAVVNLGPIAISAAAEPWQSYESGVFSSDCGTDVDHAIQLVGYGHDSSVNLDYWQVRNSWSASWGENGYIRVARYGGTPKGEPCGKDTSPGDGDGCKGGPSSIEVCGLCGILSDSSYPTGAAVIN